ncbi:MAG: hypothetical protein A2W35_03715, partial [Chloroflexi bacterium RBG_16_57_11]
MTRNANGLILFRVLLVIMILSLAGVIPNIFSVEASPSFQVNQTISLPPNKDNTLYEDATGSTSNGAGSYFFAGQTAAGQIRRAVMAFDIAGNIPAGSTINSVMLTLNMSRTQAGNQTVSLNRLTANWGEGTSNADANEGQGAPATIGDATWLHTFYNTSFWTTVGGDFSATASASAVVGGIGFYTWGSTSQMVADVQGWLNTPGSNFGWVLLGNEVASTTAKRFDSRNNASAVNRPVLVINYTPPGGTNTPTNTPTSTNTPTNTPTSTSTAT